MAKQTKVARELKYSTQGTDLNALRAELAGDRPSAPRVAEPAPVEDDLDELYAKYVVDDELED